MIYEKLFSEKCKNIYVCMCIIETIIVANYYNIKILNKKYKICI